MNKNQFNLLIEAEWNMPDDYVPDKHNPRDPAYIGPEKSSVSFDDAVEKFSVANDNWDIDITDAVSKHLQFTNTLHYTILKKLIEFNKQQVDWFEPKAEYDIARDMYIDKGMLDKTIEELPFDKQLQTLYYAIMTDVFRGLSYEEKEKYSN